MQSKIQIEKVEPTAYKAMLGLESYIQHSGLEKKLIELIKIRASQINGCAFCIDLHAHLARENGETEQRLYTLSAWRETPFFTQGDVKPIEHRHLVEQFLQAWTEGDLPGLLKLMATDVTLLSDGGGKVVAALKPLYGDIKVARFLIAIRRHKVLPTFTSRLTQVNGQSVVNYADGCLHSTMTFEMSSDRLCSIFAVVNPEKLKSIH